MNDIGAIIVFLAACVLAFPLVEQLWNAVARWERKFRRKIRDRNRYDRGYIRRP